MHDEMHAKRQKKSTQLQAGATVQYFASMEDLILVGTYKRGQLERWPGYYNFPLRSEDQFGELEASRVKELWLFLGREEQRSFNARFLGIKTREELKNKYGYPGTGRAHGEKYLLFKTKPIETTGETASKKVLVRLSDFHVSQRWQKQIKSWLEGDRLTRDGELDKIPKILTELPKDGLFVCESAIQLSLFADEIYWSAPKKRVQHVTEKGKLCGPVAAYSRELHQRQGFLFRTPEQNCDGHDVRVLELFAGVGGFRVGLERASVRYKTVWNNQWEPSTKRQDASFIYCQRFGYEGHSNEDIAVVPVNEIPDGDLLVGGFPCQDYSVANTLKHAGGIVGKKGVLWWQIHRILRDAKNPPPFLFLENVDRLLKSPASQRGRDFAIILASLSDLGYAVEWRIINAADYGMPQRRRRTYIVAYRRGTKLAREVEGIAAKNPETWLTDRGVIAQAFEARPEREGKVQSFPLQGGLAEITENFNAGKGKSGTSPFRNAGMMVNRQVWTTDMESSYAGAIVVLRDILVNEEEVPEEFFIGDEDLQVWRYLKGAKSEERVTANGFKYHYTEGGMAFPDSLEKPSRTIITGEGGTSPSRFKHVVQTPSGRYRRLTPLELERLNMFPDHHTEGASNGRRAFLMGNALVTGIVERIGLSLLARMQ